ncbi:MAG: Rab family GTPase [Candidatus Thorarchaeota archaeon]
MLPVIVPGTTIAVTLVLGYLEIRDKGIVLKKIKVKNRSFDEVVKDLEVFFKARGKRLAPGIIEETLTRIGVPRARSILVGPPDEEEQEKPSSKDAGKTKAKEQSASSKPSPAVEKATSTTGPSEPPADPETDTQRPSASHEAKNESVQVAPPKAETHEAEHDEVSTDQVALLEAPVESTVSGSEMSASSSIAEVSSSASMTEAIDATGIKFLSGNDFSDIMDALAAVESLSDDFVPPTEEQSSKPERPQIRISVSGTEELRASQKTYAAEADKSPSIEPEPTVEAVSDETTDVSEPGAPLPDKTPDTKDHIIKPIVTAKVIVLGEEGVGKKSLLEKAKMGHPKLDGVEQVHIYENIYELATHRVHLQSWCFDDAANAHVSRSEFYKNTGVVIIVYSVTDRWSFESVDFWIKESTNSLGYTPPIILVGNKMDLHAAGVDSGETPVSQDEGYKLAETLANRFGTEGKLHPIGFVETSCLSGAGVDSVFVTAAKLWLMAKGK